MQRFSCPFCQMPIAGNASQCGYCNAAISPAPQFIEAVEELIGIQKNQAKQLELVQENQRRAIELLDRISTVVVGAAAYIIITAIIDRF